jgi:hypothetical protein
MNPEDLNLTLVDLLQAAVDLGCAIEADVKGDGQISEETVIYLNDFRQKHDALANVLDILNGIN